ncbi:MAG: hypothetical protein J7M25_05555 [Deltaproteobacteria bacterium]|nr:hypothetical protein [Deltaproteobacteria bacterium]
MRAAGPGGIVSFLAVAFLAISAIVGGGLRRTTVGRPDSSVQGHGARLKDPAVIQRNFQSGKYSRKEAWFYRRVSGKQGGGAQEGEGPSRHGDAAHSGQDKSAGPVRDVR